MKQEQKLEECDCEDWKQFIPMINDYIVWGILHHKQDYQGRQFQYCPWCGKKRQPAKKGKS